MDETTALIDRLKEQNPDWVHAGDPKAHEALSNGKVLFDVNPDAALLKKFVTENVSEFGSDFKMANDGGFRWVEVDGMRVYCTYSPDLFYKYTAQSELWKLEEKYPELFV